MAYRKKRGSRRRRKKAGGWKRPRNVFSRRIGRRY